MKATMKIIAVVAAMLAVVSCAFFVHHHRVLPAYIGLDIPFDPQIWKNTKGGTVRYRMAKDIVRQLDGTDFDHDRIVFLLGIPALAYNLILVARNVKDFENIAAEFTLKIENWFE